MKLIAGERRWRASKLVGLEEILSRIIIVDDFQAREMALAENLQREDLSAIEETWGITKLIDIQLHNTCEEYKKICQENYIGCNTKGEFLWNDQSCRERVKFVLMKADSDRRRNTEHLSHNIMGQIENAFQLINKKVTWRSFYVNNLPDIVNIDQEVQEVAIDRKLGFETIPCRIEDYESEEDQNIAVIEYNRYRNKVYEEMMKEADILHRKEIENLSKIFLRNFLLECIICRKVDNTIIEGCKI